MANSNMQATDAVAQDNQSVRDQKLALMIRCTPPL